MNNHVHYHVLTRWGMHILLFFLVAFFFTGFKPLKAESLDLDVTKIDKAVVRFLVKNPAGGEAVGSGVIISHDGYILTNHHVVQYEDEQAEPGRKVIILKKDIDGSKDYIEGEVRVVDLQSDLAIVKIDKTGLEHINLAFSSPSKGDKVYALGFPAVADDLLGTEIDTKNLDSVPQNFIEATFTQGVISREASFSSYEHAKEQSWYQHSATIHPGNSGGPLLNQCGQLVGINTFGHEAVPGMYFASTLTYVSKFLNDQHIPFTQDHETCSQSIVPAWMIGLLSLLTVLVMASIYLAIKKPKVIREKVLETYSQWIRRAKSNQSSSDLPDINRLLKDDQWQLISTTDNKTLYIFDALYDNATWIIGRDAKVADIKLYDNSVSKAHLTLSYKDNHFYIEDMNSTNGTKLDGQRIRPFVRVQVSKNSHINIGAHELILKKGI